MRYWRCQRQSTLADRGNVLGNEDRCDVSVLERKLTNGGYVSTESDLGDTGVLEAVCTDIFSSVLKVDARKACTAKERALCAGILEGEQACVRATVNVNGCKSGTALERTCTDRRNLCGDVDSGKSSVACERISSDGYNGCGDREVSECCGLECSLTDGDGVLGKSCRGESLTVIKGIFSNNNGILTF